MVFDQIVAAVPPGAVIPKPHATAPFKMKGVGRRRGDDALIYFIPNHRDPSHPYQKGVTRSELEQARHELRHAGRITRNWFNRELRGAATEGGCNFTTIGGFFALIGIARYSAAGVYEFVDRKGDDG